jgi:hypothetical protein
VQLLVLLPVPQLVLPPEIVIVDTPYSVTVIGGKVSVPLVVPDETTVTRG